VTASTPPRVALVHDYLTQLGGAERVALELTRAFPGAPLHTSLYAPDLTYAELRDVEVRTSALDRVPYFRRHHRAAFPFLAPTFSAMHVDADVVVCSSSGWAHGVRTTAPKVVYCHAVARWLAQPDRYLGADDSGRRRAARAALALGTPALRRWDQHAARSATRYVANSAVTRDYVHTHYGIEARVIHPPATVLDAPARPLPGLAPGFLLVVSRLLPYKHVDAVCAAFAALPDEHLLVVGDGPERDRLRARAGDNVELRDHLDDGELRWCYEQAVGLVAASREDFGLTVLEAATAGRPVAALHAGGFLETVVDGTTGVFFADPDPRAIADAVVRLRARSWDEHAIRDHAAQFAPARFRARMREVVDEVAALS
jgi:glycosyltransferase involved in cell wall biosynthesis